MSTSRPFSFFSPFLPSTHAPVLPCLSLSPQLPGARAPLLALARVREGAFEGYRALVDARLPGTERVRVLLKMLNDRYVPLEVDLELLERDGGKVLSFQRSAFSH